MKKGMRQADSEEESLGSYCNIRDQGRGKCAGKLSSHQSVALCGDGDVSVTPGKWLRVRPRDVSLKFTNYEKSNQRVAPVPSTSLLYTTKIL